MRLFLLFLWLIPLGSSAQSNLWEVYKGKKKCGYLLGTIHISDAQLESIYPRIEKPLEKSDVIACELDLSAINPMELLGLIRNDSISLKEILGEEYTKVAATFKSITDLDLAILDKHYPFFVIGHLIRVMGTNDNQDPMDLRIIKSVEGKGKTVVGLETLSDQLALVIDLSLELQKELLISFIQDFEQEKANYNSLLKTYLEGDMDSLRMLSTDPSLPKEMQDAFLQDRDAKMVEKLSALYSKGKVFTAIGAAHLGGESGVMSGLEKKGFHFKIID